MSTIKEVADRADVSPSTVSRVINDNSQITEETRQRVLKAIEELDYQPNILARNLVNQKSNNIGLVIPYSAEETFADPFYTEVLRGIGAVNQTRDYSLLLINYDDETEEMQEALQAVRGQQVAGLLLMQAKKNDPLVNKLNELEFPFVIVGRPEDEENNYWVNNNNLQAGRKMVEYLIAEGHKNIGLVAGSKDYTVCQDRWEGYRQALEANDLSYNQEHVSWVEGAQTEIKQRTKKMLANYPEISALAGFDDLTAYWIMKAVWELDLKVPDDIAVVGFNNHPLSRLINPKLTTIDINIYQLGVQATKLLIDVIEDDQVEYTHEIIPTNLIVRQSS